MMKSVLLRPDVLRHARHHAEDETEDAVEPIGVEQAIVAAFVHQDENAKEEEAHQQRHGGGERVRNAGARCDGELRGTRAARGW